MEGKIKRRFANWAKKKFFLHEQKIKKSLYFREGQIWWAALGQNIGVELVGKSDQFHRPVLILKKYNEQMCFVLPLTTKIKDREVWYHIDIPGEKRLRVANLTQGRTMSVKRLLRRQGTLDADKLYRIKKLFCKQFFL